MHSLRKELVNPDFEGNRTIILIPSITFDRYILESYPGPEYYDERFLYFLSYLRQPNTKLIAVISEGMQASYLDYVLEHSAKKLKISIDALKERFVHVSVPARKDYSLLENVLNNELVIDEIKNNISDPKNSYIEYFTTQKEEMDLSKKLGVPYYGLEEQALFLHNKSGSRRIFQEAEIRIPRGFDNVFSLKDIQEKVNQLFEMPNVNECIAKMDDGGTGIGIVRIKREMAESSYDEFCKSFVLPERRGLEDFEKHFEKAGGVVEEFLSAKYVTSPSVQFEIKPDGEIVNLATHDQIMEGTEYVGASFPASSGYREELIRKGYIVAEKMRDYGARGIQAIDFLATRNDPDEEWELWGMELNPRKGGTTPPYGWVQFFTDAVYNEARGIFESPCGDVYYQVCRPDMANAKLKGVDVDILINKLRENNYDFNYETCDGLFVQLGSSIKPFGKYEIVAMGHSREEILEWSKKLETCVNSIV